MVDEHSDAARIVALAMASVHEGQRSMLLRQIMAVSAGGIAHIEGFRSAAETTYLLADTLVSRSGT